MIRRPPRSTLDRSSAASDVYKRQVLVYLIVILAVVAAMWKIFEKAGKPGWAAIVPIYNIVILLEIIGKPVWWIVLMLIPFVNLIVGIMLYIELAKSFGKGAGVGTVSYTHLTLQTRDLG